MIADESVRQFHYQAAEALIAQYHNDYQLPQGYYGVLAWHWGLACHWPAAIEAALDEAEQRIAEKNVHDARFWCERALEHLSRLETDEHSRFALRTYTLAWTVLDFGGQHEDARNYAERLLEMTEQTERPLAIGGAWLALGRTQRALFDFASAEVAFLRALDIARQHQLSMLEAEVLFHLGKTQQLQGRHLEAIQSYSMAHERGVVIDDRLTLAKIITSLGDVYRLLGAGRQATEHYERALQIEEHLPGKLGIAIVQEKLALSYLDMGEHDLALRCQAESLMLREQLSDQVGIARAYTVLGTIHSHRGDHPTAISAYSRALHIERSLQNIHGLVTIHNRLGDTFHATHDYSAANTHYHQALEYARSINDTLGIALIYERLGQLAHAWNDVHAASQHWNAALVIRQQLNHYDEQQRLRQKLRQLGETT